MQRPRTGHDLIGATAVDDVHQVGFDPANHDVSMLRKPDELFLLGQDFVDELLDCQLPLVSKHAGVATVFKPLEKTGEYPVHLDHLEIKVSDLRQPELTVLLLQSHQTFSPSP